MKKIRLILGLFYSVTFLHAGEKTQSYYVWKSSFTTAELNTAKAKGYSLHPINIKNTYSNQVTQTDENQILLVTPKDDDEKTYFQNLKNDKKIILLQESEIIKEFNSRTGQEETKVIKTKFEDKPIFQVNISS